MPSATQRREDAITIVRAAIAAVEPATCVRRALDLRGATVYVQGRPYDLDSVDRIMVLGAGKGSAAMAAGLEDVLGDRISGGRVTVKYGHSQPLRHIDIGEAGHPVPDVAGVNEAQKALRLAAEAGRRDLVFCLISGGGSALWPAPVDGITLDEKQTTTRLLLGCGASIDEINSVRKHISAIKGGQLAKAVAPAQLVGLMLSDVIGDRLDVIASGPTSPDDHHFSDAWAVLEKYRLQDKVPQSVRAYLRRGLEERVPDTPKRDDPAFQRVQNVIVGSNRLALKAASETAEKRGYATRIVTSERSGDTADLAREIRETVEQSRGISTPQCLLWGGETTVVLCENPGEGGRNQQLALAVALAIEGREDVTFASVGTDGTDGPTDAAGGVVDGGTVARARDKGFDPGRHLAGNDAYPLLNACGDLVVTGPTNTNVMDVQVLLLG
ncbi:MAG: glycerate kinase [Candidatus Zixiibacteriota bacterium]